MQKLRFAGENADTEAMSNEHGRIEKALARGQRISRQPWKAWAADGRYLGIHPTRHGALIAISQHAESRLAFDEEGQS